ncbi:AbrB family transcriptional regulator [Rhodococcus sp. BP-252]|uniref:Ammonia monooxygenase n=1 Tax=Rhodococcoides kyotonense TaxID=398843 RepID=A0A177YGE8_9NOCA|nr:MULTISPECIES: AbrB family transcriptional regulator [Rhodococcus]MBY6414184.1 AbrB family transcriptional regulator [Rhodococcus sp. BP-320]MBY6418952.1 AbrB family transcriptional regulator [Rhodococcus sp. BP-321]MBY6423705.1 AbrB family transcriptional regulator [Rhodococcus sp. BP-324]MBY6428989.1 AbrB family transcriptional regulator [Rhodococcus sp. BP-323]MBY6433994.1 AbrB family transcriptional regulator [Rhodococcus sp. BP-322]
MFRWLALLAVTSVVWAVMAALGLSAAALFASLVVAAVFAVRGAGPDRLPRPAGMLAQGILAVSVGLMVDTETLSALGSSWLPALGVCIATLVVSVAAGMLLAFHRDVDALTGALSMIAGGAQGLVAVSRELGGDERMVAVVQYMRVGLIIVTMPLVATLVFGAGTSGAASTGSGETPWYVDLLVVAGAIVVGIVVARLIRLPAPATLGPLAVSMGMELSGWIDGVTAPTVLLPIAFVLIGWQAGLAFTRDSVRAVGRVMPWAVALILVVGGVCALLGLLLSHVAGISLLEGYLATTPGGLSAVLAVSAASGANVTFVAAVQVVRLVIMLFAAPFGAKVFLALRARRSRNAERENASVS